MSGIAAIIYKDQQKRVHTDDLTKLIRPIVYPDTGNVKSKYWKNVGIVVYDQFSDDADHLIYENDQLLVVCNAEIYNYQEFIQKDGEDDFSEAEIIADLFKKNDRDWWKNVNGPFSVIIWDKRKREGFAYTDRIGIKPLVYYTDDEKIIVASRIKSISTLPGFNKELDRQAIFSYILMEMIPTPYTIFKDIKKLESGHFLQIRNGSVSPQIYWNMKYPPEKLTNQKEIEEKVYNLTLIAVESMVNYRSSVTDVGAFLSGGTDSSTIAGLMHQLSPGESKTFSIGFDEPGYDEMHYARIAAEAFQTQHTEYYVTPEDVLDALPKIVDAFDEPFANSSVIPAYFCARLAKEQGLQVILGGDGGDEIFGGNARYHQHFADFERYPKWLIDSLWPFLNILPEWSRFSIISKVYNHIKRSRAPLHQRIHAYNLLYYMNIQDIFSPEFLNGGNYFLPEDISEQYIKQAHSPDILDQYLFNDLKLTLMDNDIRKVNHMAEMAQMQIRYPFLDLNLVDFTGLISSQLKVKNGNLRYIFKETFNKILPDEIINKTKHGFGLPIVPWMMKPGKLNDIMKTVIFDHKTNQRGIFEKAFLNKLYRSSITDNTPFYGTYLYYLLILELWMREHIDN